MALSPDGQLVAVGQYEQAGWVELWDLASAVRVRQHQGGEAVGDLSFSASGGVLAAGRGDGGVTLWDVPSGNVLAEWPRPGVSACHGAAFHPLLDEIVAVGGESSILIRNAQSGEVQRELAMPNPPAQCEVSQLAYRPDGGALAAAMFWEQSIALWEGGTFAGDLTHPDSGTVWRIAWSPDGRLLAAVENASSQGRQVVLWDVQEKRVVRVLDGLGGEPAFSPDGSLLVAETVESSGTTLTVTIRVLAIQP
jgi:WD40 repeat protein